MLRETSVSKNSIETEFPWFLIMKRVWTKMEASKCEARNSVPMLWDQGWVLVSHITLRNGFGIRVDQYGSASICRNTFGRKRCVLVGGLCVNQLFLVIEKCLWQHTWKEKALLSSQFGRFMFKSRPCWSGLWSGQQMAMLRYMRRKNYIVSQAAERYWIQKILMRATF